MRNLLILVISLAFLSGCASADRTSLTISFEPLKTKDGEQQFKFVTMTNFMYPPDTKDGEDVRMEWLKTWLTANNMCKNGYEITERKEVSTGALLASAKHIYYTGKCK